MVQNKGLLQTVHNEKGVLQRIPQGYRKILMDVLLIVIEDHSIDQCHMHANQSDRSQDDQQPTGRTQMNIIHDRHHNPKEETLQSTERRHRNAEC
jgi:hypothetical protein